MNDTILDEFEPIMPERKYKMSTKLARTYAKSTDNLRKTASEQPKLLRIIKSASNRPNRGGRKI